MGAVGRVVRVAAGGAVAAAATWTLARRLRQYPPRLERLLPGVAADSLPGEADASSGGMAGEVTGARATGTAADNAVAAGTDSTPPSLWLRQNFQGAQVSLVGGPALAAGAAVGIVLAPGVPGRVRVAGTLTTLAAGAVGLYDDLAGDSSSKGLAGHLSAARHGEITTGAVKVAVIGLSGVAGAALVSRSVLDTVVGGAAIAGHANLVNLLDLRPGRAGKAALLHAPLVLRGPAAGVGGCALGAVVATLPDDLGERTMLGDAGANALGGLLGLAMVAREGRVARLAHLATVTAAILASEKVSFTQVIERTPILRELDQLGRRGT